jgi:YVTN family beta-propeller protein
MRYSKFSSLAAGLCLLFTAAHLSAAPAGSPYHLLKKVPFAAAQGGREYFDYITFDPGSRRAYLSHGSEVLVVNGATGALVGKITGLKQDHGVAIVPQAGRGFVSDGAAGEAVMFDLKTLKTIGHIQAKQDADSIIYDPASRHVFVFEGDPNNVTVIDPVTAKVVGNLPLGGSPEQAVADGKGMIYDNLEDKDEVVAIDSRTLKITARWPVAPAGHPVAMAMDREHRRLFIGTRDPKMLVVMNADSGKIIGPGFEIGGRVDTAIFDPATDLIACSTGDGTIDIFHEDSPDKISKVQTVKTEFGAKTMALDPKTHDLLVDTADFEQPAAGSGGKRQRPRAKPGTFRLLIYAR